MCACVRVHSPPKAIGAYVSFSIAVQFLCYCCCAAFCVSVLFTRYFLSIKQATRSTVTHLKVNFDKNVQNQRWFRIYWVILHQMGVLVRYFLLNRRLTKGSRSNAHNTIEMRWKCNTLLFWSTESQLNPIFPLHKRRGCGCVWWFRKTMRNVSDFISFHFFYSIADWLLSMPCVRVCAFLSV